MYVPMGLPPPPTPSPQPTSFLFWCCSVGVCSSSMPDKRWPLGAQEFFFQIFFLDDSYSARYIFFVFWLILVVSLRVTDQKKK